MAHVVVLTDGSESDDRLVAEAGAQAGPYGAVVALAVLPGSLVSGIHPPSARGRARREHENAATRRLSAQLGRVRIECEARTLALFGDAVDDTLLLATNLGADVVVVRADSPTVERLRQQSPTPVLEVPQAEAPA